MRDEMLNKIVTAEKKKYQVIVLIVLMLIFVALIFVQRENYQKILFKSAPNRLPKWNIMFPDI